MRRSLAIISACVVHLGGAALAHGCEETIYKGIPYVFCTVEPDAEDIRVFLNNKDGDNLGSFAAVRSMVEAEGEALLFAMNGGMYHRNRSPVGLYVEGGNKLKRINTRKGPGNFHMLPNGVFFVDATGSARVLESKAYISGDIDVREATQSGPMLVIDGALHPRFLENSDSLKRRNGVGVRPDGTVVFAIADTPVRFWDFATFFRDEMNTPNALYLDGTISRLYAPSLDRDDPGLPMGPIIGVLGPPAAPPAAPPAGPPER